MTDGIRDKQIILGVCGGIAAYKSVELLRLMTKQGGRVRVVMTPHAREFVAPLTFQALSGEPVCLDLFDRTDRDASIRHIDWAQEADAAVIAPATANMVSKLANGLADDALSTFLLAMTCPVLVCPSMNTHMFRHPSVARNLETLRKDGHTVLEPGAGQLACGTVGPGRLPEPEQILDRLIALLAPKDLAGKRVLVTAGPTQEFIDPVRFISNPSSGKMGFAVARAAEHRGADVTLVSGPTHLPDPANLRTVRVTSAREMARAVFDHFEDADIVIKTAAVSDYRPRRMADQKIKKGAEEMTLSLLKNEDILKTIGRRKRPDQFVAGFAAETEDLRENARKKLTEKNLDMIVGNLVGNPDSGFSADTNRVTLFYPDRDREPLEMMEKEAVAHLILDRIIERMP